ncbi:MAG: dual specificity protein phosphatase family protein, partial [Verrucomicrobiota bacterium]|nr:dual specificity protein phosphatase family protein [Verrucomicrobiota bacterium]
AGGAVIPVTLTVWLWPWGVLLLWPAVSLGLVASAYFGSGPAIFRKYKGRLHWSARLALAPCLLGQRLSLLYYQRQCRPWDKVTPQVWIGRQLTQTEAASAARLGVTAVLDLTAEFCETKPFRSLAYCNIPILDLTAPSTEQMREMATFIEEQSGRGVVYIHCKIGYSRTAAAVAAYLLQTGKAHSVPEALALLHHLRPAIVVRREVSSALSEFAAFLSPREVASP